MAEEVLVTRESIAKPRKAVCAAKNCKAPFSISLTDPFLLLNAVCQVASIDTSEVYFLVLTMFGVTTQGPK